MAGKNAGGTAALPPPPPEVRLDDSGGRMGTTTSLTSPSLTGRPIAPANWRARLQLLIEEPRSSWAALAIYVVLMVMVIVSAVVLCMDTLAAFEDNETIRRIEVVCAIVFSIEFIARVVSWPHSYALMLVSSVIFIDLLSILPFYVQLILNTSTDASSGEGGAAINVIGIMRLLRLLRLLKLVRHYEGSAVLAHALQHSQGALLVPLFFLGLLTFVFAGVVYYIEGVIGDNEDFDNIFKAAWFVLVTLSTVGYGDISPTTALGKAVTVPIIIAGVLFMAMPISIVGNNFTLIWQERQVLMVVAAIHAILKERNMTETDVIEVFCEMDSDGDGQLDMPEFRQALALMGIKLHSRELAQTFHAFDGDMNGTVDYHEFCEKVWPNHARQGRTTGAVKLLHAIDKKIARANGSKVSVFGVRAHEPSPGSDEASPPTAEEPEAAAGVQMGPVEAAASREGLQVAAGPAAAAAEAPPPLAPSESAAAFAAERRPSRTASDLGAQAREASARLQSMRAGATADRFAAVAAERLATLERNLARIGEHLGVDLEPPPVGPDGVFLVPATPVGGGNKGSRSSLRRQSTR